MGITVLGITEIAIIERPISDLAVTRLLCFMSIWSTSVTPEALGRSEIPLSALTNHEVGYFIENKSES